MSLTQHEDVTEQLHGLIVYTDGSANPNPGYLGSGMHGYGYIYPELNEKPTKINAWHATDRGYLLEKDIAVENARPVIVKYYLDAFFPWSITGSNNEAEILAVSQFFDSFSSLIDKSPKILFCPDSQYVINGSTDWIYKWIRNDWVTTTGKLVSNREHWEGLLERLDAYKKTGEISFRWVRGHNEDLGNTKADYMAGMASNTATAHITKSYTSLVKPQGYWKNECDLHPLIGLKRLFFNTDAEQNTEGRYYMTGFSDNKHITGKRTADAVFAVLDLYAPDPVVGAVMERQCEAQHAYNGIVYIKLDRLRSSDVYPYLSEHGKYALSSTRKNRNLLFLDKKPVTFEVNPGEMPFKTLDTLNHLEELLGAFKTRDLETDAIPEGGFQYKLHDVTDHFYDRGEKRKGKEVFQIRTLKKEFGVGVKDARIEITEVVEDKPKKLKLIIAFMDDIPARNTMKRLEELDPRVYVITWRESPSLLRYATVIQTVDAVGIWSNFFANQLFV